MASQPSYAVFAEHSPAMKPMRPAFNVRVFNRTEVRSGHDIRLEEGTGVITLSPGTYHLTGFSAVAYYTPDDPPEMICIRSPANGGYCRLRDLAVPVKEGLASNELAIVVGSATSANAVPSLVETYFHTDVEARIVMEHQCGNAVPDIFLQVDAGGSPWHVFARLCIRRL